MFKILILALLLTSFSMCSEEQTPQMPTPAGFALPSEVTAQSRESNFGGIESMNEGPKVCESVWANGSVCNGASLLAFDETVTASIEKNVQDLIAAFAAESKPKKKECHHTWTTTTTRITIRHDCSLCRHRRNNNWKRSYHRHKICHHRDESVAETFKKATETCWNFLKTGRNALLCYLCSSENPDYFAHKKALLQPSDCSSMLNSCHKFYVMAIREISKTNPESVKNVQTQAHLKKFNEYVKFSNLEELLYRYNSKRPCVEVANQLCTRLYNVYKKPLFELFSGLLVELKKSDSHSRNLQGDLLNPLLSTNPFESDVAILNPSDNMFTAYEGAKGTAQTFEHSSYKPMNMSMTFP